MRPHPMIAVPADRTSTDATGEEETDDVNKLLATVMAVLALATVLVGFQVAPRSPGEEVARALSGSSFQAGNIISDANFFDGDAMSASAVQSFLDDQIGTCKSTSCLNVGTSSLNAHAADPMCGAVTGGSGLSAATIITRVAVACGISPKVILVTLQKEQGLVSGSTAQKPSSGVLSRAMGYACPDTTNGACDPAYSGVGNQVYWAAWQWKRYANPAGTSKYFTWYAPGTTAAVQYDVPTSCGTKSVTITDQATADLYYYTPYTPNAAALANLYGTGDACSAYGNRNFWRLYNDWFGEPTAGAASPVGSFDGATGGFDELSVRGWAMDGDVDDPIRVRVTVDGGSPTTMTADQTRADVGRAYPGRGSDHGFSGTLAAAAGSHQVCVTAVGVGSGQTTALGCRTLTVTSASPIGAVDQAQASPGGIRVRGWTLDPQTSDSIRVAVYVDHTHTTTLASGARSDVGRASGLGSAHGFDETLPATAGTHTVCVYGINVDEGSNALIGSCSTVHVPGSSPTGSLDGVTTTTNSVAVAGWALDGDTTGPVAVTVTVDGKAQRVTASASRSDVARLYPVYGAAHGFSTSVPAGNGSHTVCVTAVNTGAGSDTSLGCRTVSVVNQAPKGSLDQVAAVTGGVHVRGWTFDPDAPTTSIAVHVYVDTRATALTASTSRPDVARSFSGIGTAHGFDATVPAAKGSHRVCVYAIDATGGSNPTLGCSTVTVR
ncbi:hypothetical protein DEI93_10400 [Curtobacterium sp. MCBD17_035]|uniref:hypothetical protein n=1 Tax=Curtobacterium sp. MCBD17_035 TaxID=2175673 RepID=UPI0011B48447|nr:hypothetical protein [Curtobacterium sp. MCBD17_035]WIB66395.1 hypothetical protein DEI93_10400 [Curtobacterium sp. MCBD17_035]